MRGSTTCQEPRNHWGWRVGWRAVKMDGRDQDCLSGERVLDAGGNSYFQKYSPKGSLWPCCTELRTFSFPTEGCNSTLTILAPLAEDKLHINYSDIILSFTNSMWANSHYRNACCSKIDCIMIWNNMDRIRLLQLHSFFSFHYHVSPSPSYLQIKLSFSRKRDNRLKRTCW